MYEVRLTRRAERSLRRIRQGDKGSYRRLVGTLGSLSDDPRPPGVVKLKGIEPAAWRLRVSNYRIVYEIHDDQLLVLVINLGPRGEIYR